MKRVFSVVTTLTLVVAPLLWMTTGARAIDHDFTDYSGVRPSERLLSEGVQQTSLAQKKKAPKSSPAASTRKATRTDRKATTVQATSSPAVNAGPK